MWSNGKQRRIYHMVNIMTLRKAKVEGLLWFFGQSSLILHLCLVIFFLILSIDQTLGVYCIPTTTTNTTWQYVYPFIFTLQICLPLIFNVFSLLFVARVISLYIRFFLRLDNLSTFQYSPWRYMYHQHWSSPARISSRCVMT